jgi:hypothetical protein
MQGLANQKNALSNIRRGEIKDNNITDNNITLGELYLFCKLNKTFKEDQKEKVIDISSEYHIGRAKSIIKFIEEDKRVDTGDKNFTYNFTAAYLEQGFWAGENSRFGTMFLRIIGLIAVVTVTLVAIQALPLILTMTAFEISILMIFGKIAESILTAFMLFFLTSYIFPKEDRANETYEFHKKFVQFLIQDLKQEESHAAVHQKDIHTINGVKICYPISLILFFTNIKESSIIKTLSKFDPMIKSRFCWIRKFFKKEIDEENVNILNLDNIDVDVNCDLSKSQYLQLQTEKAMLKLYYKKQDAKEFSSFLDELKDRAQRTNINLDIQTVNKIKLIKEVGIEGINLR